MAIDPNIALQVKPPQFADPQQQLGQSLALRNQLQQGQIGQQQLQAGKLELQQKQMDFEDQQKFRQAWQTANGDPEAAFQEAAKLGVGPKTLMAAQQSLIALKEAKAKLSGAELDNQDKKNDQLHALLDPVGQEQNPEKQAALWQQQQAEGVKRGLLTPKEVAEHPYPGPQGVQGYISALNTDKWVTAQAAQSRAQASTTDAANNTTRLNAELPKIKADATRAQITADMLKKSQDAQANGTHPIDSILPASTDKTANASYKAAFDNAASPEEQTALREAAAHHAAEIAIKTNPTVLKSESDQKVAEQAALKPGEVSKALAIETATNPLKLQQARAVAGATAGTREALTLDQDYVKKAAATEALGRVLDLTDQGNKAAGSALPTVSAMTLNELNGLKRLTRNEVQGIGGEGAGNIYDRVLGFFDKAVPGVSKIPQNIRDDMRSLQQSLGDNAYQQYQTSLDSLSKRTGVQYQPTVQAPNIRGGKVFPSDQVHAYASAHNVDDASAKKAIEAAGYTVK